MHILIFFFAGENYENKPSEWRESWSQGENVSSPESPASGSQYCYSRRWRRPVSACCSLPWQISPHPWRLRSREKLVVKSHSRRPCTSLRAEGERRAQRQSSPHGQAILSRRHWRYSAHHVSRVSNQGKKVSNALRFIVNYLRDSTVFFPTSKYVWTFFENLLSLDHLLFQDMNY